jgi:hypothetical protein
VVTRVEHHALGPPQVKDGGTYVGCRHGGADLDAEVRARAA